MDLEVVNGDFSGPFVKHLGLEITELRGDRVEARWTASEKHHQPFGIVHGGVHASVVETLGSIGASVWLSDTVGDEGKCVGVSNTTDFYRAVREGELTSVGTPVHQGRSQQVWLIETHDAEGRLVARGQLRVQNLSS
jgi:1,4-dihydroxy-2-naphthoyl-CoA hydrolase